MHRLAGSTRGVWGESPSLNSSPSVDANRGDMVTKTSLGVSEMASAKVASAIGVRIDDVGGDTEIPDRLPSWREFCLFLPVHVARRVDTEFPYRVRIVDRGSRLPRPCLLTPSLLPRQFNKYFIWQAPWALTRNCGNPDPNTIREGGNRDLVMGF